MGKKKEDMDDEMYVTLSLDDGDVECVVITIFTAGEIILHCFRQRK